MSSSVKLQLPYKGNSADNLKPINLKKRYPAEPMPENHCNRVRF